MATSAASSSSSAHRIWQSAYYDEDDVKGLLLHAAAGNNVPQLEYAQSLLPACTIFNYEYIDKVVEKAGECGSVDVILRIVGMCGEPELANELFNAALAAAASAEQVSVVETLVKSVMTDPNYVSDGQIIQDIAALIQSYLETLVFSHDTNGAFNGSPFDVFLIKNGLPQQPAPNETPLQFSHRLLRLVAGLPNPQWVTDPADGHFMTDAHGQIFQFGSNELAGMEIFFMDSANLDVATNLELQGVTTGIEVGNCIACHTPPTFTDFLFHNNGAAQTEYDAIHGAGAFMNLSVPGLAMRQTNYDAYLPPTTNHPHATDVFETPPTPGNPGQVDLGLWNVFANPDFPAPQAGLQQIMPLLLTAPPPRIGWAGMNGNNFYLTGTNGSPGWTYRVLAGTNLSSPLAEWAVLATNSFDGEGHFSFTNAVDPNVPQKFYAVSLGTLPQATALPGMIALFKTPGVRDLVSSEPYLHTGRMNTIEDVLGFYLNVSAQARAGIIRNAAPQLSAITLDASAVAPLAAFLRALDEENYADIPCPCP